MIKNILLTGKSGCGKSTLINEILEELDVMYSGYRTLPYSINGVDKGYYLHGYVEVENNFSPISVKTGKNSCFSITETFESLGSSILEQSRYDRNSKIILMDEIGILEDNALKFKEEIIKTLNCKKMVIGVIKRKENIFLNGILNRDDTLILDLERLSRRTIKSNIISAIKSN